MIYVILFVVLVAAIAIVTDRLNAKTPCNHSWDQHDNSFKCSKCGKKIPDYVTQNIDSYSEAA